LLGRAAGFEVEAAGAGASGAGDENQDVRNDM
jgi:hypothetical protein